MSIRSCHSPTYNPSVASRFTLKTRSLYYSCKVLLHLAFALPPSSSSHVSPLTSTPQPLWHFSVLRTHGGVSSVWGFPTCCLSPCPSQLFQALHLRDSTSSFTSWLKSHPVRGVVPWSPCVVSPLQPLHRCSLPGCDAHWSKASRLFLPCCHHAPRSPQAASDTGWQQVWPGGA